MTVAIGAIAVTVVTVIEARATDTEAEVAMAATVTVHKMALLTLPLLLLAPQIRMLKPLTTTLNMPNGPLTMLPTQLRILMLPMVALRQLWLNTRRATDSTTDKLTQPDRPSLLHLALELQHHHLHPPQSLQATELLHHLHRLPLVRQELAMVQYLHHQACKCFAASSISPKCTDDRFLDFTVRQAVQARVMYSLVAILVADSLSKSLSRSRRLV